MRRLFAGCACVFWLLAFAPVSAEAATCAEYDTQAEAQRAADTRDADGDGVYCETLPCPCLRQGGDGASNPARSERRRAQEIDARITAVVDGDTVKVRAFGARRRHYTVRLIGIDTPETKRPGVAVECGGKEATNHMLRLAFTAPADVDGNGLYDDEGGTGRRVTLKTDPTQDTFDRYDRLLAYVTTRVGANLAVRQLRVGWAKVYVYDAPFKRFARFRDVQRDARAADRGVWEMCGGRFHTPDR